QAMATITGSSLCFPESRELSWGPEQGKVIFHLAVIKDIIAGSMANSDQSQAISREVFEFQGRRSTALSEPDGAAARVTPTSLWSHFLNHEWSSAVLYLFLDVVCWVAIYRVAGWFRYDAFYATPFQF